MEWIAITVLAVLISVMMVRALNARSERVRAMAPSPADVHRVAAVTSAQDAWQQFGADPQEREGAINRKFDGRVGTVGFDATWEFDYAYTHSSGVTETAYSSMSFSITRELAALEQHEIELLRAAYLLYNADLIDVPTWRDLAFCLVYGDGEAKILGCEYREPVALPFSDGPGAIRYYADSHHATVAGATSKILAIVNAQVREPDGPPLVRAMLSRLQEGDRV